MDHHFLETKNFTTIALQGCSIEKSRHIKPLYIHWMAVTEDCGGTYLQN
jgi:hypothetical protein